MTLVEEKQKFEQNKKIYESAILRFIGIDKEYDIFNTSVPFQKDGKIYIYGRMEKRDDWSRSWTRLFVQTGKDCYTLVPDTMIYQLEDPFIAVIDGELIFGGTHARIKQSELDTYYAYFYKGKDLNDLFYFTTGPDFMKDIRLVQLTDKRIGVFSRPRSEEIRKKYSSESIVGFTIINNLDELSADVIENASIVEGLFDKDEWGGCNQAYCLDSGMIGVIGHKCYRSEDDLLVYFNISFVLDPTTNKISDMKIIGTRSCYPDGPAKVPNLIDCAFTSGIVMREDGRVDLYSGIGDTAEGRIVIDYPFEGYGKILSQFTI